ncbi:hypothetical protein KAU19_00490 [Candidatus Parcubacteria bacterium]|nr:hypothetical protein [Candidatus Parcubacteria bacterium]
MPRLITDDTMETGNIGGMQAFKFSNTRIEHLGATEYTLVTIAVDETGSVYGFENDLRNSLITAVEACKKSPRSDNLLLRVIKFSTMFPNGVEELHGFKPLAEINPQNDYPQFNPGGMTPLNDACYSAIGAMNVYGKKLIDDDFGVNAIAFIITDGGENASTATMAMVKEESNKAITGEIVESIVSVLIGINAAEYKQELIEFKDEAGLTQFIDAGKATKGKLAKLADFVSQSVSSQSQSLGTGGPSQNISATI